MEEKNRPYKKYVEKGMKLFYESLNEKDKRHYAAVEAHKLGHGYVSYISELFSCSRQTIYSGLEELENKDFLDADKIRREGGGRKDVLKKTEQ
jgi:DeoR/GlpR family transcriptional regulator of sugar metabolism